MLSGVVSGHREDKPRGVAGTADPCPQGEPSRRARLLVIDDEPTMGRAVQRMLGTEHDVEATTDPVGALQRLREGARFDVILCDLMMPTLTGMDLYDGVVAIDAQQASRVVFMTGDASTPRAKAFFERVTNTRLVKPIDRATLRAAIHPHLS